MHLNSGNSHSLNKNNNGFIFNESKLIITKIISKFKINQKNENNQNIIKENINYKNLVINKLISLFINHKKKENFIIVKQIKNDIIKNSKEKSFSNLIIQKNNNFGYNKELKKKVKLCICRNNKFNYLSHRNININKNFIIHKTINTIINYDSYTYFENIINYLKNNLDLLTKITKIFNLDKNYFNNKNIFINRVINNCIIDKLKNDNNNKRFNENKLIINKIIKNLYIHKIKKKEYIINKQLTNYFPSYKNKNKSHSEYIITKINNNYYIKPMNIDLIIHKTQNNYHIFGKKEKIINNFNNKNLVINKIINRLYFNKNKKKDNIITKTVKESINLKDDNIIEQTKYRLISNKINYEKNLIINKIISKFEIINLKKSTNLFISYNNQLFIKKIKNAFFNDKLKNLNYININELNKHKNSISQESTKGIEMKKEDINISNDSPCKRKKKIKIFKSKKLFISYDNQLKIKGIKNKE